jgi:hypothetical protein
VTLLQLPPWTGTWAYFTTIISSVVYTAIPAISLVWGIHPVVLSGRFTLAATLYFVAGALCCRLFSLNRSRSRTPTLSRVTVCD